MQSAGSFNPDQMLPVIYVAPEAGIAEANGIRVSEADFADLIVES